MTTAGAIKEMMEAWNTILQRVAETYPDLPSEERYQIAKKAMSHSLGIPDEWDS